MPTQSPAEAEKPSSALLELAEQLGALAESYDRVLDALVKVARQERGGFVAAMAEAAIARGRQLGAEQLRAAVARSLARDQ